MVPTAGTSLIGGALLCLALYNRLASMVSRLRGFQRERLKEYQEYAEHVRTGSEDASTLELHQRMLDMLEVQTRRVYRRARLMRFAIMFLLSAVAALTLCSLTTGMALLVPALNGAARVTAEIIATGTTDVEMTFVQSCGGMFARLLNQ